MLVDNVLNGADPKTEAYFQSLEPNASSITQKDVTVLAEHQISEVKIRHMDKSGLSSQYGLQPNIIVIYGQLYGVSLLAGHDTNVTTIDGTRANPDDQERKYDEVGAYAMNRDDLENAIAAGAYDKPKYFEKALNKELHGIDYQLPTRLHLNILNISEPNEISSTDVNRVNKAPEEQLVMVTDAKPILRFDHRKPSQYNNFDFFLSQSIDDIYQDFEANDDGVGMDDLIINQQNRTEQSASRQTKHLMASLSSTPSIQKSSAKSAKEKALKAEADSTGNIHNAKPDSATAAKDQEMATKEHISNQEHVVTNELNMNPNSSAETSDDSSAAVDTKSKQSSAKSSAIESSENQGISPSASTVTNEMNMMSPSESSSTDSSGHNPAPNKTRGVKLDDTPDL